MEGIRQFIPFDSRFNFRNRLWGGQMRRFLGSRANGSERARGLVGAKGGLTLGFGDQYSIEKVLSSLFYPFLVQYPHTFDVEGQMGVRNFLGKRPSVLLSIEAGFLTRHGSPLLQTFHPLILSYLNRRFQPSIAPLGRRQPLLVLLSTGSQNLFHACSEKIYITRKMHRLKRIARLYDANPSFKALLPFAEEVLAASSTPSGKWLRALTQQFLGPSGRYVPTKSGRGPSLQRFVDHVQRSPALASEDAEFLRDSSLLAEQMLAQLVELARPGLEAPELDLPHLAGVEGELERTTALEVGTAILSNPAETMPGRSVDLVFKMEPLRRAGDGAKEPSAVTVSTVAVHRPFPFTVGELLGIEMGPLTNNYVFHGGRDDDEIYMLHAFPDVGHATVLTDNGLCLGAQIEQVATLIESGEASPTDFKIIMGSSRLEFDVQHGSFSGMPGAVLVAGEALRDLATVPAMVEAPGVDEASPWSAYDHNRFFHQNVLWSDAIRRLGGEWTMLADLHPAIVETVQSMLLADDDDEDGTLEEKSARA